MLILADVFEAFREMGMKNFGLDPAHYVSAPQFAWDSMLKTTKAKVDLISDPAMYEMIRSGIRGGICMISQRLSRANHKKMGKDYNASKDKFTIAYFDANNLYGHALSQPLPISDFRWIDKEDAPKPEEWLLKDPADKFGYVVECDLKYPESLHDLHNEYPLAPERVVIEQEMLSETQLQIRMHYNISNAKTSKLVSHLGDREHYVLHSSALRFYLEQGMELIRVHRIVQFQQSDWMKPYVDLCSGLRAQAKNEFEKDFFKIMVNSVYGKTVENQSKRTNIKIVQSRAECMKLTQKPQCISFRIFSENLAAVQSKKPIVLIDKPFYVGFSVLDISKIWMFQFHYRVIKPFFHQYARLLFTDTDSLMYEIEAGYKQVYECFQYFEKRGDDLFDFSSLPRSHFCFSDKNKKVVGKFKDESGGDPILEFIGLRPKMYSIKTLTDLVVKEKHRAKGVQFAASRNLTHAQYLTQLFEPTENRLTNRRIGSSLHVLYTYANDKRALCSFDDKRFLCEDGIHTLAFGHKKLQPLVSMSVEENQSTAHTDSDLFI